MMTENIIDNTNIMIYGSVHLIVN
ncbi:hypothetical protein KPSB59_1700007 [Klebsiella quasipneumoniae subsp. quasipneumoniae]|nr:hypothetical protein KPSB59_1700007 [Klebsiella quasipneumoniae subsp. quasipneumoniae]